MSDTNSPTRLPAEQKHEFFSPKSGALIAGVAAQTLRKYCTPDAIVWSTTGKPYPLFTRETLTAWAAEWRDTQDDAAKNLQAAPEAHDAR